MLYKRAESFRHQFEEPLAAEFQILVKKGTLKESRPGACRLIDVSPSGAKFKTDFDIPLNHQPIQLRIRFTLYQCPIVIEGSIVWKKPSDGQFLYGLHFGDQPETETLIIEELKLRAKSLLES